MDNRRIGFFDSGLGGLTVLPQLRKILPQESILYFGDTARTPYGSKSVPTIQRYGRQMLEFVASCDVKMVVVACNTVTTAILPSIAEEYPDLPILGIIDPLISRLPQLLPQDISTVRMGIIATEATVNSKVYRDKILAKMPTINIFSKACPLFVPLIEAGQSNTKIMAEVIHRALDDFVKKNHLTHLVLGCTHFPLLYNQISQIYPQLQLLNPSEEMAFAIKQSLLIHDQLAEVKEHEDLFFASDLSENFMDMSRLIIGSEKIVFRQHTLS